MVLTSAVLTAAPGAAEPAGTRAAAANPYTAAEACHNDFGGTWVPVSDNRRSVVTPSGTKWADVYLMWNDSTKRNCVATIKRAFVGTSTRTVAGLRVEGSDWVQDARNYQYYAAVQASACNKRVMYDGFVWNASRTTLAQGGRYTFGNGGC